MSILVAPALVVNPDRNRHGLRAPRGGCRVQGRFYRGGSFCPPYDESNPLELPSVELGGVSYLVEPGNTPSAVRLTKRVSGESYVVERHADGHASCECLGYRYRGVCKHQTMAPTIAPAPSTVVEVVATPSEVVSTRTTSPRPADVREMGSWLAMAESRAPRPALAPAHERPVSPYVQEQINFDFEHHIRTRVVGLIESERQTRQYRPDDDGRTQMLNASMAWDAIGPELREGFAEWLAAIGYRPGFEQYGTLAPDEAWSVFVEECVDGVAIEFPEPSDPGPVFTPSPEEEAEAFALLWEDESDDPAYHAWLDDLAREREAEAFSFAGLDGVRECDLFPAGYYS